MPNRAFKTIFHNGEQDLKAIVTMCVSVNNGKRFRQLDKNGRKNLSLLLKDFAKKVDDFAQEINEGVYITTTKKSQKYKRIK